MNQQVALELLEHSGVQVFVAENGKEAVELISGTPFDLVLMDIQMPVMDGFTAVQEIRGMGEAYQTLPIVAMTAHAMVGDREKSIAAGMNDHITKPIDPDVLDACLRTWIDPKKIEVEEKPGIQSSTDTESDVFLQTIMPDIDQQKGLRQVSGNTVLYESLLAEFAQDFKDAANRIRNALDEGKKEQSLLTVHTLKGLSATLGATSVHKAAVIVESALKKEQTNPDAMIKALAVALDDTIAQINAALPVVHRRHQKNSPGIDFNIDWHTLIMTFEKIRQAATANDMESDKLFSQIEEQINILFPGETRHMKQAFEIFDFKEVAKTADSLISQVGKTGQKGAENEKSNAAAGG
tara:strand:- start:187 stop:1242 length:1056 start_codon:yes stop_codon:yes gene_type:complete